MGTESEFVCKSFDFIYPTGDSRAKCMLSSDNRDNNPYSFNENQYGDYWERTGCWHGWTPDCDEDSEGSDGDSNGDSNGDWSYEEDGSGSGSGSGSDGDNGNGGIDGGCDDGWVFFRGTGNC